MEKTKKSRLQRKQAELVNTVSDQETGLPGIGADESIPLFQTITEDSPERKAVPLPPFSSTHPPLPPPPQHSWSVWALAQLEISTVSHLCL